MFVLSVLEAPKFLVFANTHGNKAIFLSAELETGTALSLPSPDRLSASPPRGGASIPRDSAPVSTGCLLLYIYIYIYYILYIIYIIIYIYYSFLVRDVTCSNVPLHLGLISHMLQDISRKAFPKVSNRRNEVLLKGNCYLGRSMKQYLVLNNCA